MKRQLLTALGLLMASTASHADMYLVARFKIEGTDFVAVNFLRDARMPDLKTCEAERRAARTTGFQIFARAYVATHRGFSSQMQTYCLQSEQQLDGLPTGGARGSISYTYLLESGEGRFTLRPFDSMGACTAVAGPGNAQSEARYCARSSQRLRSN